MSEICLAVDFECFTEIGTSLVILSHPQTTQANSSPYAFQYTPDTTDRLMTSTTTSIERQPVFRYYSYLQSSYSLSIVSLVLCFVCHVEDVLSSLQQSIVTRPWDHQSLKGSLRELQFNQGLHQPVQSGLWSLSSYIGGSFVLKGDTSILGSINCHICIDEGCVI